MSYLHLFLEPRTGDQTWDGTDVAKWQKYLKEKNNDLYPQGRANCKKFLKECAANKIAFKIVCKKTSPYWTWYYEVVDKVHADLQFNGFSAFFNVEKGDQTWEATAADVPKWEKTQNDKKNDTYVQGRELCLKFLKYCQEKGYGFKIHAKKTKPYWTWTYEVVIA